jgi:SecD/SecF fusion protein
MKRYWWKITLIVGATLACFTLMWPPEKKLKLGIDLSGGTILVYQVENLPPGATMDDLISALKKRADPEGVKEIPIRKMGDRIEIILPQATNEEVDEIKKMLTDVGQLEFRILATYKHDKDVIPRALGPLGMKSLPRYKWARLGEISTGTNPAVSGDVLTDTQQSWKKDLYAGTQIVLNGKDATGAGKTESLKVKRNTATTMTLETPVTLKSVDSYRVEFNPSRLQGGDPANLNNWAPSELIVREEKVAPGRTELFVLCNLDRQNINGGMLSLARPDVDQKFQPAVRFEFKREGARKFGQLTREHLPEENASFHYQLAILLDNLVMSAPNINSEIRESGTIEGGAQGFKQREVDHLVQVLQAGSLPASLNPVPLQEEKVGPTLGEDTIAKGVRAIIISMLVVPVFMLVYYRFAGVIAVLALVVNMILLIGSMAFIQATFSLPGLAGLALTIGMAVDANVLVFERMREEKERGANLAAQIRNGFNRAWVTIFDSHVTNFLAAVVLYLVGTDEVKGFALTMMIGMAWNLFTAVFMSRVCFEICLMKGWLKNITMLKLMDKTNIDFIGPRYYCMAGSLILILLGLVATGFRGETMFNIDFTGGTLATIRLNESDPEVQSLAESKRAAFVRQRASSVLADPTVESLRVSTDKSLTRFNIRTTDQDVSHVTTEILKAFGSTLARVELTASAPKPIAATTDTSKGASTSAANRFAGGREYELAFNRSAFNNNTQSPAQEISNVFANVLEQSKIANPKTRFEIVPVPIVADAPAAAAGSGLTLMLRTNLEPEVVQAQIDKLKHTLSDNPDFLFERLTNFSGTVAGETRRLALTATIASWAIIILYLWWRFRSFTYGLAAVLAVVHDVLITLGALAVSFWVAQIPVVSTLLQIDQFKIDLPIVAAFLTLIGFSVNDTIVIFDRIREIKGKTPQLTNKMVNDAINQTLSRTILTSFTAWLVVVILFFFGGEGLHGFAFALVVGFLSGTYSTVYIATPILIDWVAERPQTLAKAGKRLATAK